IRVARARQQPSLRWCPLRRALPVSVLFLLAVLPQACERDTATAPQPLRRSAQVARSTGIAFVSTRDGNAEIYVMNPDGSAQTRLTNDAASDRHPTWSPDGRRIAFTSTRDGNAEIYVMNADGSAPARLTNTPSNESSPAWSPAGDHI